MDTFFSVRLNGVGKKIISDIFYSFEPIVPSKEADFNSLFRNYFDSEESPNLTSLEVLFSFIETWSNLGLFVDQKTISKSFYYVLKFPKYTLQYIRIVDSYSNNSWLFHSIYYQLRKNTYNFINCMKEDNSFWFVIADILEKDFNEKYSENMIQTTIEKKPYILSAFYLFWPSEQKDLSIKHLATTVRDFCGEYKSKICRLLFKLITIIYDLKKKTQTKL